MRALEEDRAHLVSCGAPWGPPPRQGVQPNFLDPGSRQPGGSAHFAEAFTAFPLVLKVTPWKTNGAIGNPLPLEIQPPQKSNGVSEFQWISRLMCSIGIPIPHRNSKHTMNNYFSPLEIQCVFHSFVMDGQRNEHSKTNIDFKSVKIHLGSLENRCPLKPLSCL